MVPEWVVAQWVAQVELVWVVVDLLEEVVALSKSLAKKWKQSSVFRLSVSLNKPVQRPTSPAIRMKNSPPISCLKMALRVAKTRLFKLLSLHQASKLNQDKPRHSLRHKLRQKLNQRPKLMQMLRVRPNSSLLQKITHSPLITMDQARATVEKVAMATLVQVLAPVPEAKNPLSNERPSPESASQIIAIDFGGRPDRLQMI